MRLSFEQIKHVTVGAVQVEEKNGEFHFSKMTEGQLQAYRAISEAQYNNARATTGVRLDFHTTSAFIKYATINSTKYEFSVDGCLVAIDDAVKGEEIVHELPAGEHRVTLFLPAHGTPGGLFYVELEDGTTLTRHQFDRKFLFIGDSITQGWRSDINSLAYTYRVSDHFNAESIIQGTGSACFAESTLEKLDFDPDTVFVAYGTNDWVKTNPEIFRKINSRKAAIED